jgi:hypothetical protein
LYTRRKTQGVRSAHFNRAYIQAIHGIILDLARSCGQPTAMSLLSGPLHGGWKYRPSEADFWLTCPVERVLIGTT